MKERPLRTTVDRQLPVPGLARARLAPPRRVRRGRSRRALDDAVIVAIHDQVAAGLDVITDGEQTRLDFNLSFYGYLEGIDREAASPRRFGPPATTSAGAIA